MKPSVATWIENSYAGRSLPAEFGRGNCEQSFDTKLTPVAGGFLLIPNSSLQGWCLTTRSHSISFAASSSTNIFPPQVERLSKVESA